MPGMPAQAGLWETSRVTQVSDQPLYPPTRSSGAALTGVRTDKPVIELNAFQSLMRQWSKMHPYNAGQVMRVSGQADRERWKLAAESVIGELGLGKPHYMRSERAVEFIPVQEVAIETTEGGRDLQTFFNEELNRPFAAGDLPIRFCILPADPVGGEDSHFLAAVYDHWIADSRAMRELMQRIFVRYRAGGADTADSLPPLTLQAPHFNTLYRKFVGWWARASATRESLKNIWRHRRGFRLNLWDPLNFQSRFLLRELPEGLIERLYRYAKERGASVNDLFIAVIGQATGEVTAQNRLGKVRKPLHYGRRQVGIGTVVDIRDAANQPLDRVFNLYLSSYSILLDNPEKRSVDDLTRAIAAETRRIKQKQLAVRGYAALLTAQFWYDLYDSPRFRAMLLHKTVPVVAGISNVNMTGTWADVEANRTPESADTPRVLDYIRISPAGPLIPLVFTLTTIGGRLSLCVTYRIMAFHADRLTSLVDDFIERLEAVGRE